MAKRKYTKTQVMTAIRGSGGVISAIAERLGCAWNTVQSYLEAYPDVMRAYQDEQERVDDLAESVLIKSMQDGDTSSARWWLERRRRDKYATRQEVTGSDGAPVTVRLTWGDNANVDD